MSHINFVLFLRSSLQHILINKTCATMRSQLVSFKRILQGTSVNLVGSSFSFVPSSFPRRRNEFQSASKSISTVAFERASKYTNRNRYDGLFMPYSDKPNAFSSTKDDTIIIRSLEASLQANGIQVTDGAVQKLLDQREWIYPSKRVEDLRKKLNQDQLYSSFNYQHHLQSATQLFDFIKNQDSCVVYGHKAQGKTQFLFFVFQLLQAMGEKVLFLDWTIFPLIPNKKIDMTSGNFCGHLWKNSFLQMEGDVKHTLEQFYNDALPDSFGDFFYALIQQTRTKNTRIWIIVDEVVLFEKFPIRLPEEQNLGPFNWIITGSAGIGSWVGKRHLEKFVFDLPLFKKDECLTFATHLCSHLNINMEESLGVPSAGIDDWLEERFGGVVGYTAEMFLEISKGNSVSQYMTSLDDRINVLIQKTATIRSISTKQLAEDWLNEIKSRSNNWLSLRNAGLCGSSAPRGIIFALILNWLYTYYTEEDALSLVTRFRSKFAGDPGLDGCLLELEEILKLRANRSMDASLLKLRDQEWIVNATIALPPKGSFVNVFEYDESPSRLIQAKHSIGSSWTVIEVPRGFNVIDVILVNNTTGSPAIYGIQITRCTEPFAKHHTFDTCPPRSSKRLDKLWRVISHHFKLDEKTVKKFLVMLAPNCEKDKFKPPAIRHSSDYYFSPTSIITEYDPSNKKRRSSIPVSSHSPKKEKEPRTS